MIELIVVIAIIGILTALIVPALVHDERPTKGKALAKEMFYVTQDAMTDLKSVATGGILPSSSDTIFYADMDNQGNITGGGVFNPTAASDMKEDFGESAHSLGNTDAHKRLYEKLDAAYKHDINGQEGMRGCLIAVVDENYRVCEAYWVEEDDLNSAGALLKTVSGRTFVDDNKLSSGFLCTAFPTKYSSVERGFAVFAHE